MLFVMTILTFGNDDIGDDDTCNNDLLKDVRTQAKMPMLTVKQMFMMLTMLIMTIMVMMTFVTFTSFKTFEA